MGFQFNHVGGGTKTRRPITLHMKCGHLPFCCLLRRSTSADELGCRYNAGCVQPHCYLVTEDCGEQQLTLEELQVLLCALIAVT